MSESPGSLLKKNPRAVRPPLTRPSCRRQRGERPTSGRSVTPGPRKAASIGYLRAIGAAILADVAHGGAPARILDAGSGTGRNVVELDKLGCAVGIEVSAHAIALSARRGLTRLARVSIGQFPFADGAFDGVTAFDVLCHSAVEDDRGTVREFRRVLRPGGWLPLHLPAYAWLASRHDRAVQNVRRYAAGQVRATLSGSGFAVERLTFANTLLFPLAALKRLADGARPADVRRSDLQTEFGLAGALFRRVLLLEARLLRHVDLPFGLTLVALARKGK